MGRSRPAAAIAGRLAGLMLALAAGQAASTPAQAETARARVDGGVLVGQSEGDVQVFKGVPFAAPPVGPLRWRPPAAAPAWRGERDATRFGPGCPQTDGPDRGGPERASEDCLYLNVWTPAGRPRRPLPVMVWIHGGGWRGGHGSDPAFDGTAFARDGIVLVTVNYRLGALGFFAHPALTREAGPDAPLGDYGLMDNIAALQWVRRNAAAFGGDPQRVTVFGESAGGGQVLDLLTVPAARGLFQQAIVESGPAHGAARTLAMAERSGVELAARLGLPADADAAALRALPVEGLISGVKTVSPIVDGRLVKAPPQDVFAQGGAVATPLMIGTNSDEGSLTPYYGAAADQVMAGYASDGPALHRLYGAEAEDPAKLRRLLFADTVFGAPARRIAALQSRHAPSFLYRFDYVSQAARARSPGAAHGSEMVYVFDTLSRAGVPAPVEDEAVARVMHACWVAFAKTGRPECSGKSWPAYDDRTDTLMLFNASGARPVTAFDKARFDFILSKEGSAP